MEQEASQAVITQTWMLGIFGGIITFLVGLLAYFARQSFTDMKEMLEKHEVQLQDHETRLQIQAVTGNALESATRLLERLRGLNEKEDE